LKRITVWILGLSMLFPKTGFRFSVSLSRITLRDCECRARAAADQ